MKKINKTVLLGNICYIFCRHHVWCEVLCIHWVFAGIMTRLGYDSCYWMLRPVTCYNNYKPRHLSVDISATLTVLMAADVNSAIQITFLRIDRMKINQNSQNLSSEIIMSLFASENRLGVGRTVMLYDALRAETDTYLDTSDLLISWSLLSTVRLDSKYWSRSLPTIGLLFQKNKMINLKI